MKNARLHHLIGTALGMDPKDPRVGKVIHLSSLSPQQAAIYEALTSAMRNVEIMKATGLARNLIAAQLQQMARKGLVVHCDRGWKRA